MSNLFDLKKIEQSIVPALVLFSPALLSTNVRAGEAVASGLRETFLVLCDRQTAGRGQRGRVWVSHKGCITLSWCFPAGGTVSKDMSLLPLAAAVAICETIESFMPMLKPEIKWPNDVLVDGKKVSGILVESVVADRGKRSIVVGIGINLIDEDQALARSADPSQSGFPAGALVGGGAGGRSADEEAWNPDRLHDLHTDFTIALLHRLASWVQALEIASSSDSVVEFCQRRLWGRGHAIEIELPDGRRVVGRNIDIDRQGRLQLTVEQTVRRFASARIVKKVE